MVRHQAIGNDLNFMPPGLVTKQAEICSLVATVKKYFLSMITPLRDVMGHTGEDNARVSWHHATVVVARAPWVGLLAAHIPKNWKRGKGDGHL